MDFSTFLSNSEHIISILIIVLGGIGFYINNNVLQKDNARSLSKIESKIDNIDKNLQSVTLDLKEHATQAKFLSKEMDEVKRRIDKIDNRKCV